MSTPANLSQHNPWRTAVIATAAVTAVMLAIGAGAFALRKSPAVRAAASRGSARQVEERVIEDCNRYAADTERNTGRIVRDGAIGAGVGAGVGAAGGAIAKGGEGAGKGAGIGALVGATVGALRGLSEENRKTETARAAYADCLARRGY
ncbi:MAG TPA: hypothetical protein VMR86_20270 [Myxococcota bacterium]|nr:hypothetical protein [Myxococcota bacterium]